MEKYESVIGTRYKALIMSRIWSKHYRIEQMRLLWTVLALSQKNLGVKIITDEAISDLYEKVKVIDIDKINEYEALLKHDIMAHIKAYSDLCPIGGKILHLGATSNFINDNVDSILIKKSFKKIKDQLNDLIMGMVNNANKTASIPTIAYTHLQPAQLITIGRRFSMWSEDLIMDKEELNKLLIPFRGIKGTVGSEDTLMKLFENDTNKCDELNKELARAYGFENTIFVCGQTYSRKYDVRYIHILSSICQSIYKMMNDLRLLSGKQEVYEDFSEHQVGSSAMPYKKNPITCEKICSLCRFVINNEQNMTQTYINQWLERSLDDSAIKRIVLPECFLLMEHILDSSLEVITKLKFNTEYIKKQVNNHMINIISEEIILKGVEMGYNRQDIHERLRLILTMNIYPTFDILSSDVIIRNIIENNKISFNPLDYIGRSIEQSNIRYK